MSNDDARHFERIRTSIIGLDVPTELLMRYAGEVDEGEARKLEAIALNLVALRECATDSINQLGQVLGGYEK